MAAPAPDPTEQDRQQALMLLDQLDAWLLYMEGKIGTNHAAEKLPELASIVQQLGAPLNSFPASATGFGHLKEHSQHLTTALSGHNKSHGKAHKHYKEVVESSRQLRAVL